MNALAKELVTNFEDVGVADKVNDTTLKSQVNDTEVELLQDEENEELLNVYSNGVLVSSLSYDDADFNSKLFDVVSGELNF